MYRILAIKGLPLQPSMPQSTPMWLSSEETHVRLHCKLPLGKGKKNYSSSKWNKISNEIRNESSLRKYQNCKQVSNTYTNSQAN
jgi:hypothetical protein